MNIRSFALLAMLPFAIAACRGEDPGTNQLDEQPAYVTLGADLARLREDFDAASDKVRLLFISGPSCGICLRGMDDLNKALIASIQDDPRIHTFVVQVPTLGAKEHHAAAAVALMPGPRVSHYWDPEGTTGIEFQQALGIDIYAWDVWLVYEPGALWTDEAPVPAFWQHQLPPLPEETRLDAEDFAAYVNARLQAVPESRVARIEAGASEHPEPEMFDVAQPLAVMIRSNHQSRGGYKSIKALASVSFKGTTEIDGRRFPVEIKTSRPSGYERIVNVDGEQSALRFNGAQVLHEGDGQTTLPAAIVDAWLPSFEFDGWMTDWKAKGHEVRRLGMKKRDNRLPWLVQAELSNGQRWHIYVDSHSGDAYRQALVDADGNETVALEFAAYRDAHGYRFPHEVRYFDNGSLLAIDRYDEIGVSVSNAGSD